jgi:phage gpG-like protein
MATVVVFNHFPRIAAQLKPMLQQGIKTTAKDMVGFASGTAPRDTGFMGDNVYYSAHDESSYGQGPAPSKKGSYLLPEVLPSSDMEVIVGAAANYSIYVNYGHHTSSGSYVPAQPFWEPTTEHGKQILNDELAIIGAGLGGSIV